jgi:CheY-like chemotaxis protein
MKIEDAKILLVDDDTVMRMFVVNLLSRLGAHHIQEAADGQQGLQLASNFNPDIVLSDIHMSPMDGLEFVKRLRTHAVLALRKIPVILMSADSSGQMPNDWVPLGISGYIIKPPVLSVLNVKLEHALKFR